MNLTSIFIWHITQCVTVTPCVLCLSFLSPPPPAPPYCAFLPFLFWQRRGAVVAFRHTCSTLPIFTSWMRISSSIHPDSGFWSLLCSSGLSPLEFLPLCGFCVTPVFQAHHLDENDLTISCVGNFPRAH